MSGAIVCTDCNYPYTEEACPNPACFPGLGDYQRAFVEWERIADRYIARITQDGTGSYNYRALREGYERLHPRPITRDFRKTVDAS